MNDPTDTTDSKNCPHCKSSIKQNAIVCRFCKRGVSSKHFKKCPNCAELVRNKASRCRYCKKKISGDGLGPSSGSDPFAPVPRIPRIPQGESAVALPLPICADLPGEEDPV